jgi:hypothetical protein
MPLLAYTVNSPGLALQGRWSHVVLSKDTLEGVASVPASLGRPSRVDGIRDRPALSPRAKLPWAVRPTVRVTLRTWPRSRRS